MDAQTAFHCKYTNSYKIRRVIVNISQKKLSHIVYIVGFAGGGGGQFLGRVADYAVPDAFVVAFNPP